MIGNWDLCESFSYGKEQSSLRRASHRNRFEGEVVHEVENEQGLVIKGMGSMIVVVVRVLVPVRERGVGRSESVLNTVNL